MGQEDLRLVWVDTHAHLFDDAFREDFDATLMRARGRGVHRIVLPNIDVESLPLLFSLYQGHPDVFRCAVGLHPTSVNADWLESLNHLKVSLDREGVVAIGEVGLDLYWDTSSFTEQQNALRVQMEWALERDLALFMREMPSTRCSRLSKPLVCARCAWSSTRSTALRSSTGGPWRAAIRGSGWAALLRIGMVFPLGLSPRSISRGLLWRRIALTSRPLRIAVRGTNPPFWWIPPRIWPRRGVYPWKLSPR